MFLKRVSQNKNAYSVNLTYLYLEEDFQSIFTFTSPPQTTAESFINCVNYHKPKMLTTFIFKSQILVQLSLQPDFALT